MEPKEYLGITLMLRDAAKVFEIYSDRSTYRLACELLVQEKKYHEYLLRFGSPAEIEVNQSNIIFLREHLERLREYENRIKVERILEKG